MYVCKYVWTIKNPQQFLIPKSFPSYHPRLSHVMCIVTTGITQRGTAQPNSHPLCYNDQDL